MSSPRPDPVPATVQHGHVVELQALGTVRGSEQKPALSASSLASPLSQPLDEAVDSRFGASGLQIVFAYCFQSSSIHGPVGCPDIQLVSSGPDTSFESIPRTHLRSA